jgi:ribokinase
MPTRVAVVGHVEWVDFLRVDHLPVRGEVQAAQREMTQAGGGAVVAAAVLAELGAEVEFFGAVGRDADGEAAIEEIQARGITVHAARREAPTRRVITLLDRGGERTIVTLGPRLQPDGDDDLDWQRLATADGVYFTAGDVQAARRARRAGVLVVTPRMRGRLDNDIRLDAVVFSATDEDEAAWADDLTAQTRLMVATEGQDGGRWWGESSGRWEAVAPEGPIRDSYGCGDSFAAGFTFGLSAGMSVGEAADVGARCGARMLSRVGGP